MTPELFALLLILAVALVSFYTQWIRSDLTALSVLMAMLVPWRATDDGLQALLTPAEAFSGFGSTAIMMVIAMFAVSSGLVRTGAAELVGRRLFVRYAHSELRLQAAVLTSVALFSAVLNDTTAVLVWMPVVVSFCKERNLSPSRYLLAVAYGSLLGGQWTLIGTRSNLIVSDYLAQRTGEGLRFFQFTPFAVAIFLACLTFYLAIGVRLLPRPNREESLADAYQVTDFLSEVMVTPRSGAIGASIHDLGLKQREGLEIIEIIRDGDHLRPQPWIRLHADDVLIVQGSSAHLARLLKTPDYEIRKELKVGPNTLRSVDLMMVEAQVPRNSALIGRTPAEIDLLEQYGMSLMAVSREGRALGERPTTLPLKMGDMLLLCGHAESVELVKKGRDLLLADSRPFPHLRPGRALVMSAILVAAVVTAATGALPTATALAFAAALTVATGCVRIRELYKVIDWTAVVVVGGMMPFGLALEKTKSNEIIADAFAHHFAGLGPMLLLALLLLAALVMTQLIEKTAVAIIFSPLYYDLAGKLDLAPEPLLLGLALILSAAFMTPIAHESTILVMGPGRYQFRHYIQLGGGFAFVTWIMTTLLVGGMYALR